MTAQDEQMLHVTPRSVPSLLMLFVAVVGCHERVAAPDAASDAPDAQVMAMHDGQVSPADTRRDTIVAQDDANAEVNGTSTDASSSTSGSDAAVPDAKPTVWPPPGDDYFTQIQTDQQFTALGSPEVMFIVRRPGIGAEVPYPWDRFECIFQNPKKYRFHLDFLNKIDPDRAVQLYFAHAKSPSGGLILGGVILRGGTLRIQIENFPLFTPNTHFPLAPQVIQEIRERILRCMPFAAGLKIEVTYFCKEPSSSATTSCSAP